MQDVIYLASVKPLEDPEVYGRLYAAASPRRREKLGRLRFRRDRLLSLGAEGLLLHALRSAGCPAEGLTYAPGKNGKPRLAGPEGFRFNLSHSGEYVMLAVSRREIGCDIQEIRPIAPRLPARVLDPREHALFSACGDGEREELFFRYWVLKESCMKASGEGLAMGPSSLHVELSEPIRVYRRGELLDYALGEWGDIPGCRCAVCREGAEEALDIARELVDLGEWREESPQ